MLPHLRKALDSDRQIEQIVVGDFNLHHEMWGGPYISRGEAETEDLVELMEEYNLTNPSKRET